MEHLSIRLYCGRMSFAQGDGKCRRLELTPAAGHALAIVLMKHKVRQKRQT